MGQKDAHFSCTFLTKEIIDTQNLMFFLYFPKMEFLSPITCLLKIIRKEKNFRQYNLGRGSTPITFRCQTSITECARVLNALHRSLLEHSTQSDSRSYILRFSFEEGLAISL